MSQETSVRLISDLSGAEASVTVGFSIDGRGFDVDLTDEEAKELREFLLPYQNAGRRSHIPAGHTRSPRRLRVGSPTAGIPGNSSAIRQWAKDNGIKVSDRGRIPRETQRLHQEYLEQQRAGGGTGGDVAQAS